MTADPASILDQKSAPDLFPDLKVDRWSLIILLLALVFMTVIGWGKWGDILVDFDFQIYAPWQVSQGQVLYKDIHYINGPLSI